MKKKKPTPKKRVRKPTVTQTLKNQVHELEEQLETLRNAEDAKDLADRRRKQAHEYAKTEIESLQTQLNATAQKRLDEIGRAYGVQATLRMILSVGN